MKLLSLRRQNLLMLKKLLLTLLIKHQRKKHRLKRLLKMQKHLLQLLKRLQRQQMMLLKLSKILHSKKAHFLHNSEEQLCFRYMERTVGKTLCRSDSVRSVLLTILFKYYQIINQGYVNKWIHPTQANQRHSVNL